MPNPVPIPSAGGGGKWSCHYSGMFNIAYHSVGGNHVAQCVPTKAFVPSRALLSVNTHDGGAANSGSITFGLYGTNNVLIMQLTMNALGGGGFSSFTSNYRPNFNGYSPMPEMSENLLTYVKVISNTLAGGTLPKLLVNVSIWE